MINKNKFSAPALRALEILNSHKKCAYIVGGSVRDILMGTEPKDYDIATEALPDETLKIFSDYKTFETGIRYGTVTVIIENTPIEITTFRADGEYKNSRKPESVSFSESIEADLSRRDFTINAMAYSPVSGFIDLFGGTDDINNKIIRAIGNPDERFTEDALRILRALRFASRLGFCLEPNTREAVFKNKELLLNISAERIREEFNKILTGKYAVTILSEYRDIIAVFLPEIVYSFDFDQKSRHHIYDVYTHMLKALENTASDLTVRLAVFFHDIAKPLCFTTDKNGLRHYKGHPEAGAELTRKILRRLKYDNKTISEVTALIKYHDTNIAPVKAEVKKYLNLLGEELSEKLFAVKFADSSGKPDRGGERYKDAVAAQKLMKEIIAARECYTLKALAIDGKDLLKENIPQKQIGKILNTLLTLVMEEKFKNEKSVLLKYALENTESIIS